MNGLGLGCSHDWDPDAVICSGRLGGRPLTGSPPRGSCRHCAMATRASVKERMRERERERMREREREFLRHTSVFQEASISSF